MKLIAIVLIAVAVFGAQTCAEEALKLNEKDQQKINDCLKETEFTMDEFTVLMRKPLDEVLTAGEQEFTCCITKRLEVDGKLNTEIAEEVIKEHATNSSVTLSSIVSACEAKGMDSNDLTTCPKKATFFHCFFSMLHKPDVPATKN